MNGNERLYHLLPKLYQKKDFQAGQPLRALMSVLEEEFSTLHTDIDALYDNWFVETCDDWTLPYLAKLVGIDRLGDGTSWHFTERRRVANTLAYRRRKGTASVLEHVIRDVSGWHCRVHESSRNVSAHPRLTESQRPQGRTVDLRDRLALEELDGPFSTTAQSAEIPTQHQGAPAGSTDGDREKRVLHPAGLSVHLYRLRTYPVMRAALSVDNPHCFRFDALGRDTPLFHFPQEQADVDCRAERVHLPTPITRAALAEDLADFEIQQNDLEPELRPHNSVYYGPQRSLALARPPIDNASGVPSRSDDPASSWDAVHPWQLASEDLTVWPTDQQRADLARRHPGKRVLIDPELGRLVVLDDSFAQAGDHIRANYTYGFGDDIGGGPYQRAPLSTEAAPCVMTVGELAEFADLEQAAAHWNAMCLGHDPNHPDSADTAPVGIIRILDSGCYSADHLSITLPTGSRLAVVAADGMRPTLRIAGGWTIDESNGHSPRSESEQKIPSSAANGERELYLQGLLLDGSIVISGGGGAASKTTTEPATEPPTSLGRLNLVVSHCTLVPSSAHPSIHADACVDHVRIENSITGSLVFARQSNLHVRRSIIGGTPGETAIRGGSDRPDSGPLVELEQSTVLGNLSNCRIRSAINVLFTHLPETKNLTFCREAPREAFRSLRCGEPYYGQLKDSCPPEILGGGEDGAQPGAFHRTFRPRRLAGLQEVLDEYAPMGLDVQVIFET